MWPTLTQRARQIHDLVARGFLLMLMPPGAGREIGDYGITDDLDHGQPFGPGAPDEG